MAKNQELGSNVFLIIINYVRDKLDNKTCEGIFVGQDLMYRPRIFDGRISKDLQGTMR